MRIAVLGPLEARTDDDVPVVVPGVQERLLLAGHELPDDAVGVAARRLCERPS